MVILKKIGIWFLTLTVAAASLAVAFALLLAMLQITGSVEGKMPDAVDVAIIDRYDMYITNQISSALEGVLSIDKVYWLSDDDKVAPEPNQACYGVADSPTELGWLLEKAKKLLNGQETLFNTETVIAEGTKINYYLDDTILAIIWRQSVEDCMYTVSEVKLAHPSQFRRFLSGGVYGSEQQILTTQMASSVNAVLATSGDYYANRRLGVIVYDGKVKRVNSKSMETCYIDDNGDMSFSHLGELPDMKRAQAYVDENNIRFSVAFGPILVENGVPRKSYEYADYIMGDVQGEHARIALCQRDSLHYFVVIAGQSPKNNCYRLVTLEEFQKYIVDLGCNMAYTMDGGQTATMVMNDQLMNRPSYDSQRDISDIIYFATAIPNGE